MAPKAGPKGRKRRKKGGLVRKLKKGVVGAAARYDFVDLLKRISESDSGKPWLDLYSQIPPDWQEAPNIKKLAQELTLAQLKAENIPAEPATIAGYLDEIAVRYDHQIHIWGATAVTTLLNGFFSQQDPVRCFMSADGREMQHFELLDSYRKEGLGVVYLMNHSSHLDEFIMACVMAQHGMGLPLFAAGANMMAVSSVAKVLWISSYVVRRRGAERAYLAALFNYCRAISERGCQQGIFLEAWAGGARSRDGSLRYPRRLVALRGALAGDKDVVVQPVAMSYSTVPEDLSLAARQGALVWLRGMGVLSTLGKVVLHPRSWIWRSVQDLYGRAYLTMPRPRLLSELKESHAQDKTGVSLDEHVALTAITDIARTKKVMGSQLTARGLMRARRKKEGDLEAATAAELLSLREYHQETFGREPDLEDFIVDNDMSTVVADGLRTLRRRAVLTPLGKDALGLPKVKSPKGLGYYATHGDRRLYSPTARENIVVAGAGDWGFSLVHHLGMRMLEGKRYLNASLTLFDPRRGLIEELALDRSPEGTFSEYRLPKNVFVTSDLASAFKKASEVVVACKPGEFGAQVKHMLNFAQPGLKLVVATQGMDPDSHQLPVLMAMEMAAQMGRGDVSIYSLGGAVTAEDLVEGRAARGVLAGPSAGRGGLNHLFALPPIEIVASDDAVGVALAGVMAGIYGLWGGYLTRTARINTAANVGCYLADASGEAIQLCQALGGDADSFSAASPGWASSFAAMGLGGPARDFGNKIGSLGKKGKDVVGGARKLYEQGLEADQEIGAYRDLKSICLLARQHGLELPILEEAWSTILGARV